MPFSEPLADGPVIQRATERALAAGMTLRAHARSRSPACGRSICGADRALHLRQPDLRFGLDAFVARAADAGVDGVLVLDLPIEEAGGLRDALAAAGIDIIFLLSPTTTTRADPAGGGARDAGFLYGISRLGVTGVRDRRWPTARGTGRAHPRETTLPLALGFGISRPEHIAEVGALADAAVVGSALVNVIAEAGRHRRRSWSRRSKPMCDG